MKQNIVKFLKSTLFFFFPFIALINNNRKLNKKIQELLNQDEYSKYVQKFVEIDGNDIKDMSKRIIEDRKSLTDKSKINIIGITIALSLIIGIIGFKFEIFSINTTFTFLFISFIYFILGGFISLHSLVGQEIFYLSPDEYIYLKNINNTDEAKNERKLLTARNNELNIKINMKLNNYVSCSYESMRIALISLLITSIFIFINLNDFQNRQIQTKEVNTKIEKQDVQLKDIETNLKKMNSQVKVLENELQKKKSIK